MQIFRTGVHAAKTNWNIVVTRSRIEVRTRLKQRRFSKTSIQKPQTRNLTEEFGAMLEMTYSMEVSTLHHNTSVSYFKSPKNCTTSSTTALGTSREFQIVSAHIQGMRVGTDGLYSSIS